MERNVLVYAETRNGKIRNVSLECLNLAKRVANGGRVEAVLFGRYVEEHVNILAQYGAEKVYIVEDDKFDHYSSEVYSQAFKQVIQHVQPDAIFLGHTANGRDFAPRVAARLNLGMISDIVDFKVEEDEVIFTRPIYSGKAFAKKRVVNGPIFATVRANNIGMDEPVVSKVAQVEKLSVEIKDLRSIIRKVVQKASSSVDLTEAKIIVSGGRGVRSAEGFKILQELAEVLGGAVGASRGACDQQYCDYSLQIGQTGKVVTPDLYIACGISGAIQHLAGMSNSKVIVAINTDPEAPIFKVADYGIVGDLFEVVPLLTEEFKKIINTN